MDRDSLLNKKKITSEVSKEQNLRRCPPHPPAHGGVHPALAQS